MLPINLTSGFGRKGCYGNTLFFILARAMVTFKKKFGYTRSILSDIDYHTLKMYSWKTSDQINIYPSSIRVYYVSDGINQKDVQIS